MQYVASGNTAMGLPDSLVFMTYHFTLEHWLLCIINLQTIAYLAGQLVSVYIMYIHTHTIDLRNNNFSAT